MLIDKDSSGTHVSDYHDHVRRDVLAYVHGHLGHVLDFGGGSGATSGWIRREGRASHVVVADRCEETHPNVDRALKGDLENPDFVRKLVEEGPYDTLLCLDVLEHLRDPWSVVATLVRGLKPDGTFVISVPNVNFRGLVLPLLLRGSWELTNDGILDRTHLRWFTKKSAMELMTSNNITVVSVNGTMGQRDKWLNILTGGIFERFFFVQYILIGKKLSLP